MKTLAVTYRPHTWEDVVEQDAVKAILKHQLETATTKNAYLFCGGAGTGKTTCARIFANEINEHKGSPIEIDAASNSGVNDVREISTQAQTKSIDSEYKIYIIDECHSLSNTAWQAFLKLIEEPPAKTVFIFCTTDPQKIPNTILSRVQRFDFHRISMNGIFKRLQKIMFNEFDTYSKRDFNGDEISALQYIAKVADGGMRDAITMLDKCLSLSTELTVDNVVKALGYTSYDYMFELTEAIYNKKADVVDRIINELYSTGKDLKLFVKQFMQFVLDLENYQISHNINLIQIPVSYETDIVARDYLWLLRTLVNLNNTIRWETSPKSLLLATLLLEVYDDRTN